MDTKVQMNGIALLRGIAVGVIGSVVGTLAMDVAMIIEFLLQGWPVLTYLDLIGSVFGGGIPVGVLVHVVLACLLGLVFALPVLKISVLRIDSLRRGLIVGFVIGLLSIGACVPFALLTRLPMLTVLSFMAIPHLVWGTVTGLAVAYGFRSAAIAKA